jgi:hypothetical protein
MLGFISALPTISGCSKAADRTLRIYQCQSTETYPGAFRIDTSQLTPDAIKSKTETGEPGAPVTEIELEMDYEIEVVLRAIATGQTRIGPTTNTAAQ